VYVGDRRGLPPDRCEFLARGHELGYVNTGLFARMPCRMCGTLRWVELAKGIPRTHYCRHCVSPERRQRLGLVAKGRTLTPEWRARIKESCKAAASRRVVAASRAETGQAHT